MRKIEVIRAKPIMDIMVEVKDIERVDAFNEQMAQLGYEARGENGIPFRRYFCRKREKGEHP
jgi:GrpB-like predicted nucleotidyltransferase (UPF0157 family)